MVNRSGLAALAALVIACPALAHDDAQWIMDQQVRNRVGEWCCGRGDCNPVNKDNYTTTARGYRLTETGEVIPYNETIPVSIDGRLWVCRRPNGSIRCVLDQPPGS